MSSSQMTETCGRPFVTCTAETTARCQVVEKRAWRAMTREPIRGRAESGGGGSADPPLGVPGGRWPVAGDPRSSCFRRGFGVAGEARGAVSAKSAELPKRGGGWSRSPRFWVGLCGCVCGSVGCISLYSKVHYSSTCVHTPVLFRVLCLTRTPFARRFCPPSSL